MAGIYNGNSKKGEKKLKDLIMFIMSYLLSGIFLYFYLKMDKQKRVLKNILLIISASFPILLLGLRYNVGTDYNNYVQHYYMYGKLSLFEYLSRSTEILGYIIIKIASYINDNPQTMFMIYAILTVGFIYKGILSSKNNNKIIMIYIYLFVYFSFAYNGVRQGLAVAIIFYAYSEMFYKDKKIKPMLLCIMAILTHNSSIILLPIFIINCFYGKSSLIKFRIIIYIYILSIVFFWEIIISNLLDEYSKYYSDGQISLGVGLFIQKIPLILFVLACRKQLNRNNENNIICSMFLILEIMTAYMGYISPAMARIAMYFSISKIYLISNIIDIIELKYKRGIKVGILAYIIVYFTLEFYIKGYHQIFPYSYRFLQ